MKDGDVIAFDYELWVEGQENLYDTTLREAAEKAGILQAEAYYAPMHYVAGSGRLIPGLEEALRGAAVGKTGEVTIPPDAGYGPRDAKLIETLPLQEFKKNKVDPAPGLVINYRDRRGRVTTVGGGRVRVDFNPPLAGKTLKYRFTVRSVAQSLPERVRGILQMVFPNPLEWDVQELPTKGEKTVVVHVPQHVQFDRNWLLAKVRVLSEVRRHTDVALVRYVEEFRVREKETEKAPEAAAPRT